MADIISDLDLHFKKDEVSGTVMRNAVRTLILQPDLAATPGSGTYGDVIDGAAEYSINVVGGDVATSTLAAGEWTLHLENNDANVTRIGAQWASTLTVGKLYVGEISFTLNALTAAESVPRLRCDDNMVTHLDLRDYTIGERYSVPIVFTADSSTTLYILVESPAAGQLIDVTIHSIAIYEENAGAYVNSPTLGQPGQVGRAVAYSSGTDHATIPNHDALKLGAGLADFSISLWLKTSSSSLQHIVSNYAGVNSSFELLMHTSGTPYFIGRDAGGIRQWNPTSSNCTPFNDGDWHNILLTFEFGGTAGATVRYYLDGALDYSAALPSWTPTYASALGYIAQRYDGVNPYVGLIDDIRFYSRLLDAADAKLLRRRGFPHGRYSIVRPVVGQIIVPVLE